MLEAFLTKFPRWYLTFAVTDKDEVLAYDIRYAIDDQLIVIHQSGMLPEYLLTGIWQDLKFHAHERTNQDGYKIVRCHLQDYSADAIHLVSELSGRVIGYQHNRWEQAGVRNIGSLTFLLASQISVRLFDEF